MMHFAQDKAKSSNSSLEEKRSQYACKSNYVTLENILPWSLYFRNVHSLQTSSTKSSNSSLEEKRSQYACKSNYVTLENILPWSLYSKNVHSLQTSSKFSKNADLNKKVSIFFGDITTLEIDAIISASNHFLSKARGGVAGAIHRAAGPDLFDECRNFNGCPTGEAKITSGYKLPAKYVIHTAGPIERKSNLLRRCYMNCLIISKENGLRTIAFPCIATGIYGYPKRSAAHVALKAVRLFLEQNASSFDRVIFCLFLSVDVSIYESLMPKYFPV